MRFDVVTLFPELFGPHLSQGVTRRAFNAAPGAASPVDVRLWPLRDFADDAYRRVDDRPYGGGPGMVMLAEPLLRALAAIAADRRAEPVLEGRGGDASRMDASGVGGPDPATADRMRCPAAGAPSLEVSAPVIHFSPTGRRLDQALVEQIATGPGAVLLCGRYEGIDQRLLDARVDLELSLGDYVLSGGELPALVLLDAVARLQGGVLNAPSHQQDSFSDGLLEGPHYSRPEQLAIDGALQAVPQVLMSGHHARIARWRRERALERTARRRPDLIAAARAGGRLDAEDERFLRSLAL
jgi:tRNA (guanine37-N1)-methyltransferase